MVTVNHHFQNRIGISQYRREPKTGTENSKPTIANENSL